MRYERTIFDRMHYEQRHSYRATLTHSYTRKADESHCNDSNCIKQWNKSLFRANACDNKFDFSWTPHNRWYSISSIETREKAANNFNHIKEYDVVNWCDECFFVVVDSGSNWKMSFYGLGGGLFCSPYVASSTSFEWSRIMRQLLLNFDARTVQPHTVLFCC